MRGYYAGRYIDNSQIAAQVEIRQHIYGRLGCAVWGGAGTPSLFTIKPAIIKTFRQRNGKIVWRI